MNKESKKFPTLEEQVKAVNEIFKESSSPGRSSNRICISTCGPGMYCECLKKNIPMTNEFK
jgi:hypothetical protein